MTDALDGLVEKAARAMYVITYNSKGNWAKETAAFRKGFTDTARTALEAIGLPALLERVEAAEKHRDIALSELANRLAQLGDARAERDALAAKVADLADRIAAVATIPDPATITESRDMRAHDYWRGYRAARDECVEVVRAALTEGTEGA